MKRHAKLCLPLIPALALALLAACGGGDKQPTPTPQPSAITSTLSVSPATALVADGSASADITVQLRDASGAAIENTDATVVLHADFGHLDYKKSGGQVTGTLDSTQAGEDTVSFSINGTASPHTGTAEFVAGPTSASASSIVLATPGSSGSGAIVGIADGVSPLVATVTLRDRYGNPLLHGGDAVAVFTNRGAVGPVADREDGSYTADITSITAGAVTASFALGGSESSAMSNQPRTYAPAGTSGGGGSFVPPPASAASAYMAPWTVESCNTDSTCVDSGVYEADTTNPGAPAVEVVSGTLMGTYNFGVVSRAYYDPTTDKVLQLGPAILVYAKDGRLHRLNLTHPGATPATLSTLSPTVVCSLYLKGSYGITFGASPAGEPAWVFVSGFDTAGATVDDCYSGTPQGWLVPVNADAGTIPVSGDYQRLSEAQALVNPATGLVEGLVVVDDSGNLDLYNADLTLATVLQSGFALPGSRVQVLGRALRDEILMDVISIGGGTRSDALYRVTASGASPVTTLSFSTANPYFDASKCGGSGDAATWFLESVRDSAGTVYFSYPTSSGFAIEALGPSATVTVPIYNESSSWCLNLNSNVAGSASGRMLFAEIAVPYSALPNVFRILSVNTSGPASQPPTVLVSDASSFETEIYYNSAVGDNVWIYDAHCDDPVCHTTYNVYVASPDGSSLHVFANSVIGGDAQQGSVASTGETLRKYVAITPEFQAACTSSGWVLYDPTTLTPVASPDFGSGNCSAGAFLYGPNDHFLLGNVYNDGATLAYAFALFGIGGTTVAFGPYGPAPGYSQPHVVPMY